MSDGMTVKALRDALADLPDEQRVSVTMGVRGRDFRIKAVRSTYTASGRHIGDAILSPETALEWAERTARSKATH